MSDTLKLARDLIARVSVTPDDAGCQDLIAARLQAAGFDCEHLPYGNVANLWARRGAGAPLLVLAGHTDVVPAGPSEAWDTDPFEPVVRDGKLFGRGAADMKGSLAAVVVAVERFVAKHPQHGGSIGLLITSDEEGPAVDGTRRVMETLDARGVKIDCCLVAEPSSRERLGDTIRRGRRGSLTGTLTVFGKQGHVAYPQLADNPVHRALPALRELILQKWDEGRPPFPPTSFQIANIEAGTGADNVIPGTLTAQFNFRYSSAVSADDLRARVTGMLDAAELHYDLRWHHSGAPFFTEDSVFLDAVSASVTEITGLEPQPDTGGGTSDGRFIAPYGADVVELGPVNATIHQVNEWVLVDDLETVARIYERVFEKMLLGISN